jgi:hypothetical protein
MLSTQREAPSRSKLIERLRQISRGAPAPIGFGRVAESAAPAMLLVAVLPRNEKDLAEAAIRAGADAVVLRLHGAGTEFLKETGDLAAETTALKDAFEAIGDRAIAGVIVGSNGNLAADDLAKAAQVGVDFIAAYPHLTPANFLELSDVGRVAIMDQSGGNVARGINDLSIQAALVRIDRPGDSPAEMTVLDVAAYRGAADSIHRPIIVFPSWKLLPTDLEVLKNAGIEAVALVGPNPDADAAAVEEWIRPFRDVVGRLGKPTGRRQALAEPAVIIPRSAALTEAEGDDEDGDEDDE